jgi:molecular chaperone DnaK
LTQQEIDKMRKDANEHAAEDKKRKESAEVKNQADSLVFQTKKQLTEMKDKISDGTKTRLETEIKKVEDAIATGDTEQIKAATESLNKVWSEVASEMYAQANTAGAEQGPQGGPADQGAQQEQPKPDKDVQDASYEVVDDDKDKDK